MKSEIKPEYLACPIREVISQFGDKWSLLTLYTIYDVCGEASVRYSVISQLTRFSGSFGMAPFCVHT